MTSPSERIAKRIARAGICSRREAEKLITAGRVEVDGRVIDSPALNVTQQQQIRIDGTPLPKRERTRLWLYHKPTGLVTTHKDEQHRRTVFDALPAELPRVISVGRLDINSEGLLLLTNDGALARHLELPATGWIRRYRVRIYGQITQAHIKKLAGGVTIDGMRYGKVEVVQERAQGKNSWVTVSLMEGKNREIRRLFEHFNLPVNRLIRTAYGPFQLGNQPSGMVEEVAENILRDQLGEVGE